MNYALPLDMNQLLGFIKTLSINEKTFLKTYIEKEISVERHGELTQKLLQGPTMSDDEYQSYLQLKKDFKKWTKKKILYE